MSNNNCNCLRCYRALQDRLWTVRDAIAALEKSFDDEIPDESQDELDRIMERLCCRECELEQLISEMQTEVAK